MPTPRKGYFLKNGTKVPSVTTITGRFKDAAGLLYWANTEGLEGRNLNERRDSAADVGTAAHAMVYASIRGEATTNLVELASLDDEQKDRARNSFSMYCNWAAQSRLEIIEQEMQLVSEAHRYGGTPDAIGRVHGELCLVDWKTSNDVYPEQLVQLAAYKILWEENYPDRKLTGGYHLCRFSKEYGDFAHHYYRELADGEELFLVYRKAYDLDKRLKKR